MDFKKAFTHFKNAMHLSSNLNESEATLLLKNTQLFDRLPIKEFNKLCTKVKFSRYSKGDIILQEGDLGTAFFVIQKGAVRVYTFSPQGEEIVLARLEEGNYFGEQALLTEGVGRRNATIQAITDTELLVLEAEDVKPFLRKKLIRERLEIEGAKQLLKKLISQSPALASSVDDSLLIQSKICHFPNEHIIFTQGEPPDNVYFILHGLVEIISVNPDETTIIAHVETGQLLGEIGVIENIPRAGTAIAKGEVKALAIPANLFDKLHHAVPELKKLIATLQQIYQIPQQGFVTLNTSNQDGMEVVNANLKLKNNQTAIATRIKDQNIFTLTFPGVIATKKVFYERDDEFRELTLKDNKIVGIFALGTWLQLGETCGFLIDQVEISPEQLMYFEEHGNLLASPIPRSDDPNDVICYCLKVRRYQIENAIRNGHSSFDALTDVLGAGNICGACRSDMKKIIGNPNWANVYISEVIALTSDVRVYRFKGFQALPRNYQPGQYIIIAALIKGNWIERPYTLTSVGVKHDYLEVAIKREEKGYFSNWLFDHDTSDLILKLSPPLGTFVFDTIQKAPLVFFAGGIGVTPAIAYARYLSAAKQPRRLHVDFSARNEKGHLFADEFNQLMQEHSHFTITFRSTSKDGQITQEKIQQIVNQFPDADFYICGPARFLEGVTTALEACKISKNHIKLEEYYEIGAPLKT